MRCLHFYFFAFTSDGCVNITIYGLRCGAKVADFIAAYCSVLLFRHLCCAICGGVFVLRTPATGMLDGIEFYCFERLLRTVVSTSSFNWILKLRTKLAALG
jgi:hypothetical protein